MIKKIIIITTILLIIAGGVYFIASAKNGQKNRLTFVKVTRGDILEKALAIGQIEPKKEVIVKSKISGIARRVFVDIGDLVQPGDPLIEISPDPTPLEYAEAKRNVELAQVDLELARSEYERAKELHAKDILSQQDYEPKLKNHKEAQLRLKIAEERLALIEKGKAKIADRNVESIIKSPIRGTILSRKVNEGDPIVPLTSYQAGTELFTMADMKSLLFKGTVDEIDVGKIKEGQNVNIKLGAVPDQSVGGTLIKISPKAKKEANATLFDVEIMMDESGSFPIRAGYSANAEIIIRKKENVLTIPERLIEFKNGKAFVELQGQNNQIDKKEIKTGLSDGIMIEVLEGLKEGESLVERPPKEIT